MSLLHPCSGILIRSALVCLLCWYLDRYISQLNISNTSLFH